MIRGLGVDFPGRCQFLLGALRLGLAARTALHTSRGRAVDKVGGEPALIVGLVVAAGRTFAAGERLLLERRSGFLRRPRLLGLGEEGLDVGLVDEVAGTAKGGGQDEVQEDARVE